MRTSPSLDIVVYKQAWRVCRDSLTYNNLSHMQAPPPSSAVVEVAHASDGGHCKACEEAGHKPLLQYFRMPRTTTTCL